MHRVANGSKKKPWRHKLRRERCAEAPRTARLDLTFRVGPVPLKIEDIVKASGLPPEDVKTGLDALRDTLLSNLHADKKYTRIPEVVRFRRAKQEKFKGVTSRMIGNVRHFERKVRTVRKTIIKCNALKPLLAAIA